MYPKSAFNLSLAPWNKLRKLQSEASSGGLVPSRAHMTVTGTICHTDGIQISRVSDKGLSQPNIEVPKIEPGYFCMQISCSPVSLSEPQHSPATERKKIGIG